MPALPSDADPRHVLDEANAAIRALFDRVGDREMSDGERAEYRWWRDIAVGAQLALQARAREAADDAEGGRGRELQAV